MRFRWQETASRLLAAFVAALLPSAAADSQDSIAASVTRQRECLIRALAALDRYNLSRTACHRGGFQCGSIEAIPAQVERYMRHGRVMASRVGKRATVCETGVFKGQSASVWLCSHPDISLYAFDYELDPAVRTALLLLFPGRVKLIAGSSVRTLPAFRRKHPEVRCHIASVDGGHFGFVPLHDIYNFARMARPNRSLLLMDEIDFLQPGGVDDVGIPVLPSGERSCCPSSTVAWRYAQATGLVREHRCFRHGRGWCEGHYSLDPGDPATSIGGWTSIGVP